MPELAPEPPQPGEQHADDQDDSRSQPPRRATSGLRLGQAEGVDRLEVDRRDPLARRGRSSRPGGSRRRPAGPPPRPRSRAWSVRSSLNDELATTSGAISSAASARSLVVEAAGHLAGQPTLVGLDARCRGARRARSRRGPAPPRSGPAFQRSGVEAEERRPGAVRSELGSRGLEEVRLRSAAVVRHRTPVDRRDLALEGRELDAGDRDRLLGREVVDGRDVLGRRVLGRARQDVARVRVGPRRDDVRPPRRRRRGRRAAAGRGRARGSPSSPRPARARRPATAQRRRG